MKRTYAPIAMMGIIALALFGISGCQDEATVTGTTAADDSFAKPALSTPTLSIVGSTENTITIRVTAGASGMPAGFSLQWMREDDYQTYGWASGEYSYCSASFSGNASGATYSLDAGEYIDVVVGVEEYTEPGASGGCGLLDCGTTYAFRAFAHATRAAGRSAFTQTVFGTTQDCPSISCIHYHGYWKTHSDLWPSGHAPGEAWFGSATTTWLSMMWTPAANNKEIILAQDYIETKLNICNGANPTATILTALAAAEGHFDGSAPLSDSELVAVHNTIMGDKNNMTCDGDLTYCP